MDSTGSLIDDMNSLLCEVYLGGHYAVGTAFGVDGDWPRRKNSARQRHLEHEHEAPGSLHVSSVGTCPRHPVNNPGTGVRVCARLTCLLGKQRAFGRTPTVLSSVLHLSWCHRTCSAQAPAQSGAERNGSDRGNGMATPTISYLAFQTRLLALPTDVHDT